MVATLLDMGSRAGRGGPFLSPGIIVALDEDGDGR